MTLSSKNPGVWAIHVKFASPQNDAVPMIGHELDALT
jgi:hypothetical protein